MSSVIDSIERRQRKQGLPGFDAGDRVRVHFQVVEGSRRRTQVFEGVVLRRQGSGARETFTVRKQSFGVGVERTFPLHSPKIEKLEVAARGDVRRAKLYYLRGRVGKAARVAERRWGIDEAMIYAPAAGEEPVAVDSEGETVAEAEAVRAPEPEEEASEDEAAEAAGPVAGEDSSPLPGTAAGEEPTPAPPADTEGAADESASEAVGEEDTGPEEEAEEPAEADADEEATGAPAAEPDRESGNSDEDSA